MMRGHLIAGEPRRQAWLSEVGPGEALHIHTVVHGFSRPLTEAA
jgi:hypothetical protein